VDALQKAVAFRFALSMEQHSKYASLKTSIIAQDAQMVPEIIMMSIQLVDSRWAFSQRHMRPDETSHAFAKPWAMFRRKV
jgi:hypothetical protein